MRWITPLLALLVALLASTVGTVEVLAAAPPSPAGHARLTDRDCADFATQAQAQQFFVQNGGPGSDPHNLDADGDGVVCETNPCPCSTGTGGGSQPPAPASRRVARVLSVIDGDTVRVRLVGGPVADVRLVGIDTPEVGTCGARAATRALRKELLRGTRVVLRADGPQADKDRYGRLLRYLAEGSRDVGRRQLARGFARVLVVGRGFDRLRSYRSAQGQARSRNLGNWRTCW